MTDTGLQDGSARRDRRGFTDTGSLLYVKWRDAINRLSSLGRHSRLKIAVIAVFAAAFWTVVFAVFAEGFRFMQAFGDFAPTLTEYLMSIFFFSLSLLLIFSNGIISYFSLFKSEETGYLMTLPVRNSNIFLYKLSESLVFSSWAFLFLGTPLLAAYGMRHHVQWHFYVLGLVYYLLFLLIPAGLGAMAAMVIARYIPRTRKAVLWF
ncbi:MAG: hypothetical protein RDV41_11525, partial [Planctomycetota bacterium]|nr:hypothetical protein [Planctomycetota bacterium]